MLVLSSRLHTNPPIPVQSMDVPACLSAWGKGGGKTTIPGPRIKATQVRIWEASSFAELQLSMSHLSFCTFPPSHKLSILTLCFPWTLVISKQILFYTLVGSTESQSDRAAFRAKKVARARTFIQRNLITTTIKLPRCLRKMFRGLTARNQLLPQQI